MNEAECWDCSARFNPLVAFHRNGCPECPATLERLFQQRDGEAERDPEAVEIDYPIDEPGGVVS